KRNQIAWLTLNRPEVHNSLNPEMLVSMAAAWKEIEKDYAIRVTIVARILSSFSISFHAASRLISISGLSEL
ncbi:MAG TPA: enoyl-CoA hydratase-related protein, partial [Sporolactobacillaceae bacterium]|nr:enoyl-CoA hydratase-related protein [Sporolactobacillaceae bacterium]